MTKTKRQNRQPKVIAENQAKRPAGLARTNKIIRTEKAKEILFCQMCERIKLDDFKQDRADKQLNDRISKRLTIEKKSNSI